MPKPNQSIVIKKVKKGKHAHHGGAWKIAYADFVTAMMAFFLLMWLVNMTTMEQKVGLAEFFTPEAASRSNSAAGGVLRGNTLGSSGNESTGVRAGQDARGRESGAEGRASDNETSRPSTGVQAHQSAAASIRQALQDMPEIAEISRNLVIEPTQEGVDISIVDQDGRAMFPEDSVHPYDRTRRALEAMAPVIRRMSSRIAVRGHTSAARPGERAVADPWSLTAGRAIAVREILSGAGLPEQRFKSVTGRADTEPTFPDNPYIAPNRRVTITLLAEEPPLPTSFSP